GLVPVAVDAVDLEAGPLKARAEGPLVPEGKNVAARGGLAGARVAGERVVANQRKVDSGCLMPELDGSRWRLNGAEGQLPRPDFPLPGIRPSNQVPRRPVQAEAVLCQVH